MHQNVNNIIFLLSFCFVSKFFCVNIYLPPHTWEAHVLHLILATSIFTEKKLTNQRSNCRSLYTLHHSCYFSGHPVPLTLVLEINQIIFLGFGFLVLKVSP